MAVNQTQGVCYIYISLFNEPQHLCRETENGYQIYMWKILKNWNKNLVRLTLMFFFKNLPIPIEPLCLFSIKNLYIKPYNNNNIQANKTYYFPQKLKANWEADDTFTVTYCNFKWTDFLHSSQVILTEWSRENVLFWNYLSRKNAKECLTKCLLTHLIRNV